MGKKDELDKTASIREDGHKAGYKEGFEAGRAEGHREELEELRAEHLKRVVDMFVTMKRPPAVACVYWQELDADSGRGWEHKFILRDIIMLAQKLRELGY